MTGKKKTVIKGFEYRRCDDFADYLMKMAREGWHFKEWSLGLVFERGKPEETVYAVELFTAATVYDTRPEPQTREFAEYCEAAGWELADAKGKLCIFRRIRPDAIPILTPEERLENIAREERKDVWRALLVPGMYTVMRLIDFFGHRFEGIVFSNEAMAMALIMPLLLLAAATRCIQFYLWRGSARKRLARGETVRFSRADSVLGRAGWYDHLVSWVLVAMVVFYAVTGQSRFLWILAAILVPTLILVVLLAKFRPEADTNRLIQLVFGVVMMAVLICGTAMSVIDDEPEEPETDLPLLYSDIGGTWEPESSTVYASSSVLGSYLHAFPYYDEGSFYYSLYRSGQDWILDRVWEDNTEGKRNEDRTDCTALWGAETAFQNSLGDHYVRYADAILILRMKNVGDLTAEQIDIIRQKLGLG